MVFAKYSSIYFSQNDGIVSLSTFTFLQNVFLYMLDSRLALHYVILSLKYRRLMFFSEGKRRVIEIMRLLLGVSYEMSVYKNGELYFQP